MRKYDHRFSCESQQEDEVAWFEAQCLHGNLLPVNKRSVLNPLEQQEWLHVICCMHCSMNFKDLYVETACLETRMLQNFPTLYTSSYLQ